MLTIERNAFQFRRLFLAAAAVGAFAASAVAQQGSSPETKPGTSPDSKPAGQTPEGPEHVDMSLLEGSKYVLFETTQGDIVIELEPEKAPVSSANFLQYVRDGFYDGVVFHRIVPDFVIQGGGFTPDGQQKETRKPIPNEWRNGLKNKTGTLSLARTNDPNSATSQFFINLRDNAFLDQARPETGGAGYAVFGRVIEGMDTVEKIAGVQTRRSPVTGQPEPVSPVLIEDAEIISEDRAMEFSGDEGEGAEDDGESASQPSGSGQGE